MECIYTISAKLHPAGKMPVSSALIAFRPSTPNHLHYALPRLVCLVRFEKSTNRGCRIETDETITKQIDASSIRPLDRPQNPAFLRFTPEPQLGQEIWKCRFPGAEREYIPRLFHLRPSATSGVEKSGTSTPWKKFSIEALAKLLSELLQESIQ
jgi:hypothetical protein